MCVFYIKYTHTHIYMGFPDSSVGKESACNSGDPGSIPGSGRSAGEGIGCPLQYSWASLVTQLVKNLPEMRETWIHFLGWEDSLEKGTYVYKFLYIRRHIYICVCVYIYIYAYVYYIFC